MEEAHDVQRLPASRDGAPTTRRAHLPILIAAVTLLVGVAAIPGGGVPVTTGTAGAVPDLAMSPLGDFRIEWVNGRRLLRFTAMMVNIGDGNFEVHGHRASTAQPMQVDQIIRETANPGSEVAQRIPTGAEGKWSGDGHNHWHVQEMMRYDMWGNAGTYRGAKVGFCFLDSDPWNLSLPGAASGSYYRGSWCQFTPSALSNRMGISVGWGDEYEYYLAWQWVDITGVPAGTYYVRAKVDPYGFFTELDEDNQCWYTRVSFTSSSNAVTVHGADDLCANDWSQTTFSGDVLWAFENNITGGCAPDLFCTNNAVTRAQMASFLVRALGLPPSTIDSFVDDETSVHEHDINALAASGITAGCGDGRYCPAANVPRGQMASFLVRAFDLPSTSDDYFTDDEGSMHEADINALAASGITAGCQADRFCPNSSVTRGQMVAFLHRAMR
jgi:hypothetical protein